MSGRAFVDVLIRCGHVVRALERQLMGVDRRELDRAHAVNGLFRRVDAIGDWCPGCGRSRSPSIRAHVERHAHGDRETRAGRERRDRTGMISAFEECIACNGLMANDGCPWPLVRLGRYEGEIKAAVLGAKRDLSPERARSIGRRLGLQWAAVIDELSQGHPGVGHSFRSAVVQPVPMPWLRRWERGTDHALLIARGFADATGLRVDRLLGQRWGTPRARQRGLDRRSLEPDSSVAARLFARRNRWHTRTQPPRPVVIVDDVRTSGSTLRAVALTLRSAGFGPISAAVIAVAHDDDRPP